MFENLNLAIEFGSSICERLFDGFTVTDAEIKNLCTAVECHRDSQRLSGMLDTVLAVTGYEG